MKYFALGLLIASASFFVGCEGPAGPAGANGVDGADGNANVRSENIVVTVSDWVGDGDGYDATKASTVITQEIADDGAVLCYLKEGNEYIPMPVTFSAGQGLWVSHILFTYEPNLINFTVYDDDGLTDQPGTTTFKVVAIASSQLVNNPDINFENYDEVRQAFNLED